MPWVMAQRLHFLGASTRRRQGAIDAHLRTHRAANAMTSSLRFRGQDLIEQYADNADHQNRVDDGIEARETTHETIRPHRKAARYQARQRLELEIHLRKDRRLLRSADRRRHPRPDEIDKTAGRQCRRAVRAVEIRDRDAQRDADARRGYADAADRPP